MCTSVWVFFREERSPERRECTYIVESVVNSNVVDELMAHERTQNTHHRFCVIETEGRTQTHIFGKSSAQNNSRVR